MKTYLVSFATSDFYRSQKRLNRSALKFGIDQCLSFRFKDLRKTEFYRKNKRILSQKRGAGYWLWKPYIILDTLANAQEGDIVIYNDSGAEFIDDLQPLIDICESRGGLMFFQVHNQDITDGGRHINRKWIKRDCFVLMGADTEEYYNGGQVAGSPQLYVRNKKNIEFLKELLAYCEDPRILTDKPNVCGLDNLPGFLDHRHDQSILSILAKKYDIEIFRDPSQFGDYLKMDAFKDEEDPNKDVLDAETLYPNSPYGTLINVHRKRNFSIRTELKDLGDKFTKSSYRNDLLLDDISIGITTFEVRFDEYFVPLLSTMREFDSDTEIIVVVNGEHNRVFGEEYRKRVLNFLSAQVNVYPIIFPMFRGVSKLWNTIIIHATHDHVLILNDDVMIKNLGAIEKVKSILRRNGGRSFIINDSWSHFVVSKEEIEELGYFDERLLGIGEEDGDITWRYIQKYGRGIDSHSIKEFVNYSNRTEKYKPVNIRTIGGTKYSRFNREFMFERKYRKDKKGVQGMFDDPVSVEDEGPTQYPNEKFYRMHKKDL
jgi:hypothetical protein